MIVYYSFQQNYHLHFQTAKLRTKSRVINKQQQCQQDVQFLQITNTKPPLCFGSLMQRIIFDDQFQLAMKSNNRGISKLKILEKSYEQISNLQTKPKLISHKINLLEHKKTKKGNKIFPEEWIIPFQAMRKEMISDCPVAELEYAWRTGKILNQNDEDTFLKKDSILWEEEEDLLILQYYFSPDEFSFQMIKLLSKKNSKEIIQRYTFLNIQDAEVLIHRIDEITSRLKKMKEGNIDLQ